MEWNNKLLYIKKVSEYKLKYATLDQCSAFRKGLLCVVDYDILKVFTADELRQLIYGFGKEGIDINDLQMNTVYGKNLILILYRS